MVQPYFRAEVRNGTIASSGLARHEAGRRIARNDGADDGVFAGWSWDGRSLKAQNDRFGLSPLYYWESASCIAISPSVCRLLELGAPRELDWDALGVFLRLGFFLGEATAFGAIRALPPAASFEWTTAGLKVSGGPWQAPPLDLARAEAVDAYAKTLRTAVERRLPATGDLIHPVSGGRDSRHLLLELCFVGARPRHCVTTRFFPPRATNDVEIAAALTTELGLEHVVLEQTEGQFAAELRKNELTGFCADEHVWGLTVADHLNGTGATVFDGLSGGVLSGAFHASDSRRSMIEQGRWNALAESYPQVEEAILAGMLSDEMYRRVPRGPALAAVTAEFEQHGGVPNPLLSFTFWNRTRREVSLMPNQMFGGAEVLTPYNDRDVFDLLAGLPLEISFDPDFHSDTIAHAHPHAAEVPYAVGTGSAQLSGRHAAGFAADLARFILTHDARQFLDLTWTGPRLVKGALKRRALNWLPMAAYVAQLEAVVAGRLVPRTGA